MVRRCDLDSSSESEPEVSPTDEAANDHLAFVSAYSEITDKIKQVGMKIIVYDTEKNIQHVMLTPSITLSRMSEPLIYRFVFSYASQAGLSLLVDHSGRICKRPTIKDLTSNKTVPYPNQII